MEFREYAAEDFLLDDTFLRYCIGSDEQEIAFWEDWTRKNPDREPLVREARGLLFSLGLRLSPDEKQIEFQKLRLAIRESIIGESRNKENADTEHKSRLTGQMTGLPVQDGDDGQMNPGTDGQAMIVNMPDPGPNRKWAVRIAAALILLLAGYGIKSVVDKFSGYGTNNSLVYTIYSTRSGERKTMELADGSRLILNSNSELKIPADYNSGSRNLQLSGEAFFEVAKNKSDPFEVSCGKVSVRALGTSFKVRSYSFDSSMRVALVEGSVKVDSRNTSQKSSQILLPGEEVNLNVNAASAELVKKKFDIDREWGWKEDRLIFKDASLQQIAAELEYWYGIKVNLKIRAPRHIHFNGEFVNKDIDKVLSAITFVNKLSYTLDNKEITITSL